jgi:hypothetical protein
MTPSEAEKAASRVGLATLGLGGVLAVAPGRAGRFIGLPDSLGTRIVGLADLALVPGLLRGRPRWPWMVGRVLLNLAIIGYLLTAGSGRRNRIAAVGLVVATATDLPVTRALRGGASK